MRILLEAVAARITGRCSATATSPSRADGSPNARRRVDRRATPPIPRRFVKAAGPRVVALIAQLFDHAERYRRAFGAALPDHWKARAEHRQILDAAKAGDADDTAVAIVARYLRTAKIVAHGARPELRSGSPGVAIEAVAPSIADQV